MQCPYTACTQLDERITGWTARHGVTLLRVSLGALFLWFGSLKLFPGSSPAPGLTARTIELLTFGAVSPSVMPALAFWECGIGIGLVANRFMRATLLLLFVRTLVAVSSLFLFPNEAFVVLPFTPTTEGQYVIKNIVLLGAALVVGAAVRGGRVVPGRKSLRAKLVYRRRRRIDRMRAPFPPEVLAFMLLGGAAAHWPAPETHLDIASTRHVRAVNGQARSSRRAGPARRQSEWPTAVPRNDRC
jgi:uncharacterized membrane protein YphA (DoxX/SURF4 family)